MPLMPEGTTGLAGRSTHDPDEETRCITLEISELGQRLLHITSGQPMMASIAPLSLGRKSFRIAERAEILP